MSILFHLLLSLQAAYLITIGYRLMGITLTCLLVVINYIWQEKRHMQCNQQKEKGKREKKRRISNTLSQEFKD